MIRAVAIVLAVVLDGGLLVLVAVTVRRHRRDLGTVNELTDEGVPAGLEKEPRHVR